MSILLTVALWEYWGRAEWRLLTGALPDYATLKNKKRLTIVARPGISKYCVLASKPLPFFTIPRNRYQQKNRAYSYPPYKH